MAKNKKNKNSREAENGNNQREETLIQEGIMDSPDSDELEKELLALFGSSDDILSEDEDAASTAEELLKMMSEYERVSDDSSAEAEEVVLDVVFQTAPPPSVPVFEAGSERDKTAASFDGSFAKADESIVPTPVRPSQKGGENGHRISDDHSHSKNNGDSDSKASDAVVTQKKKQKAKKKEQKRPKTTDSNPRRKETKTAPTKKDEPVAEQSSYSQTIRLTAILAVICTAIAGMLAIVNHITKDTIANNNRKAKEAAVLTVFPQGDVCREYVTPNGACVYFVAENDTVIGYCVNVSPYGYGGNIDMMVGFSVDGAVSGIKIVKLSETPGVGTKVMGEAFLAQFLGFTGNDKAEVGENVDAIGGATFSSRAVAEGVNEALSVTFDLTAAAAEVGFTLSDGTLSPDETKDSNEDNGDETLSPGEAGEVGETEPAETAPHESQTGEETVPLETEPVESEPAVTETAPPETAPSVQETTAPWVPDPWIPDPVIPDPDPIETEAPETSTSETSTSETDVVETESPETSAPETSTSETDVVETESPETSTPETSTPETDVVETESPETSAPETDAVETKAPETEPAETEPLVKELTLSLRAVDEEGNVLTDVLDAQLNNKYWLSTAYSSAYTVFIGTNTVSGWDAVPEGYNMPEDFVFTVSTDGTIVCFGSVIVDTEGDYPVFVVTLEEESYAFNH